jgi:multiple sugar transport system ATP-binding protein
MNLLRARVAGDATGAALEGADGWRIALSPRNARRALAASSPEVVMGARHSTLRLSPEAAADAIPGQVYTVEPTGDVTYVHVRLGTDTVVVSVPPHARLESNQPIWLAFDQEKMHLFDATTGSALAAS